MTNAIKINYGGATFHFYCGLESSSPGVYISLEEIKKHWDHPERWQDAMIWAMNNEEIIDSMLEYTQGYGSFYKQTPTGESIDDWLKGIKDAHSDNLVRKIAGHLLDNRERYSKWQAEQEKKQPQAKKGDGYIYLAYSESGHYKIGKSKGPESRIKVFDTQMPIGISLLHSFYADNMARAEKKLHEIYTDRRHLGEWFNLTSEDIEEIRAIDGFVNGEFI